MAEVLAAFGILTETAAPASPKPAAAPPASTSGYEQLEPYPLEFIGNPACPLSSTPSPWAGIPPETSDYRLANRSALEWLIDQHQVTEAPRSGIRSEPPTPTNTSRLDTLEIVRNLPPCRPATLGRG